jgi:indole-3-glycerol phosphate synthase
MDILGEIIHKKRQRVSDAKMRSPLVSLKNCIRGMDEVRSFGKAIARKQGENIRIIAEIKKASPSRGIIRKDFNPAEIAKIYDTKGAAAISVLTEEDYFQGSPSHIKSVKEVASRPILRKDFIFDEYQIYESRSLGADAILLIASILSRSQGSEYLHLAREIGLQVLFEVHDWRELEDVLSLGASLVGINNRNLKTMKISLDTTLDLLSDIPGDRHVVSESGIGKREDVVRLEKTRVDALLIGTSLMKERDIGKKFDELMHDPEDAVRRV